MTKEIGKSRGIISDPRSKILAASLSGFLVVIASDPVFMIIFLAFLIAEAFILGADITDMLMRSRVLVSMCIPLFIMLLVFERGGQAVVSVNETVLITSAGLIAGYSLVWRLLCIFVTASMLSSIRSAEFTAAMSSLKIPYRITFMVSGAMRFMPLLADEARDALDSLYLKGFDPKKTNLQERIRVYSRLFIPMVAKSVSRAHRISIAMEARAFGVLPKRTIMKKPKMKSVDWVFCVLALICFAMIIRLGLFS